MVTVSVQGGPRDAASWLSLARRAEDAGFDALLAADHPGATASPFVALAAAAAVTSRLRVGPYVANAGVREPMLLAADAATLDVVSSGRSLLGLGAGHTPAEWLAVGRERPGVAARVRRCIAVAEAVRTLLAGGTVDVDGPDVRLRGVLERPRPVADPVPLTVGTANTTLLRWAGANADVVGLSGLGRTRADGYSHDVRWTTAVLDDQVAAVSDGALGRSRPPALEALVQVVQVTDDVEAGLAPLGAELGLTTEQLLAVPFVLAGTEEEIVTAVAAHRHRWGVTRYVVRQDVLEDVAPLLPRLAALG